MTAALEPRRRAVFALTQFLGCTYAEAAAVCDCPPADIRTLVAQASPA